MPDYLLPCTVFLLLFLSEILCPCDRQTSHQNPSPNVSLPQCVYPHRRFPPDSLHLSIGSRAFCLSRQCPANFHCCCPNLRFPQVLCGIVLYSTCSCSFLFSKIIIYSFGKVNNMKLNQLYYSGCTLQKRTDCPLLPAINPLFIKKVFWIILRKVSYNFRIFHERLVLSFQRAYLLSAEIPLPEKHICSDP